MLLLSLVAFVAGIVTILSPCVLPVLPIILASSADAKADGSKKPYGTVLGFVLSFTFFTLFLTSLVKATGIAPDALRNLSVIVIAIFGLSLLIPRVQVYLETLFSKFSSAANTRNEGSGFLGGLVVGFSLGLLWTPCVGPILASVISLALIGDVSFAAVIITFAYSLGTALPMLLIIKTGSKLFKKVPWLTSNLDSIQKIFGALLILLAVAIHKGYDRDFQTFVLTTFPNYGTGLTMVENFDFVDERLAELSYEDGAELIPEHLKADLQTTVNKDEKYPIAPDLILGGEWLNSEPLSMEELRGKVVLVDFWTYSCINCQRTFPYLKNWWKKYEDDGLVIIGVHAPEFEFEKVLANVSEAANDFGLNYPIMQDNEFKTWRSYRNRYWPAKYLVDKEGYIRYSHFGEGKYDETEKVIQFLLEEDTEEKLSEVIANPEYNIYSRTPETYLGYSRIEGFVSPESIAKDAYSTYTTPRTMGSNKFAYDGEWIITPEYSRAKTGGKLTLNFESREVFLVMRPTVSESKVKIYLDGEQQFLGEDVDEDGIVTITSETLYKLIKLNNPSRHILEIEFLDDNTEIYAFTFG